MQNLPFTQLITPAARAARSELLDALGTENNPRQWMTFMESVRAHLPDVLSRGRPSQDAISRSLVGQLGFTSWREMIEAPTEQQGLGWSWSAWRQWSRAWRVAEDHPFLKHEEVTAAQVNKLAQLIKSEGVAWPESSEELEQFQKQLQESKAEKREQGQAALLGEIAELRAEIEQLKAARQQTIENAKSKLRKVEGERDEARRSLDSLSRQLRNQKPRPTPKLSRWQHFLSALGLR